MSDSAPPLHRSHVTLFQRRTVTYKIGLLGLVTCCCLFIVGFSTPHWISYYKNDMESVNLQWGLWSAPCEIGYFCNTALTVMQVLFSFHLAGYLLCLILAVYENCKKIDVIAYHSRIVELCVLATGFLGTAGMAVFTAWYSNSIRHDGFNWSLAIASLSLTGIYITFFLLLCGNCREPAPVGTVLRPQPGVVYYQPGNPYGTTVVQAYRPLQAGCPTSIGPQNQPLLCPQPYNFPSHVQGAPPAYTLPPAYSATPPAPTAPYPYYPAPRDETFARANAPPYEENLKV